jgi:hypothetical protein
MQPNDVARCVELTAQHPVLGRRYGRTIDDLGQAWLEVINQGTALLCTVEELDMSCATILGGSCSVFAREDFVRDLKTPPHFWIGPEIVQRIRRGKSPVLSAKEVREGNSTRGLTSVVWQVCIRLDVSNGPERSHQGTSTFFEGMRGFQLNEAIQQVESVEHAANMRLSGGMVLNPADGRYGPFPERLTQEFVETMHVAGLSRECAVAQFGSWAASMFRYQPPRIGFTPSEQRLLLAALQGDRGDRELADSLGVSVSAVKKTWLAIYDLATDAMPELFGDEGADARQGRGREKKGRLLAYLSQHPEELRPVARRGVLRARSATGQG